MDWTEHSYTDNIVCPYCGYEHEPDYDDEDGDEIECYECEKTFKVYVDYEVTYCTERID